MNMGFGLVFNAATSGVERGIGRIEGMLGDLSGTVAAVGSELRETFEHSFGLLVKTGKSLIDTSAEVEHAVQEMAFAYRDMKDVNAFEHVKEQVSDASLYSMQTQKELHDMVAMMKQVNNVDIFSPRVQQEVDKTNLAIKNSAVLLSEVGLAARSDVGLQAGIFALMNGHMKRAAMMLRPIAAHLDDYDKALAGVTDNTEKWAKLVPLLARDFGDLTNYLMDTWPYLSNQIKDVQQKLWSTLGTPMMNALKGPLHEFLDYFTKPGEGLLTHENIHKLDAMAAAFGDIGRFIATTATYLGGLARHMFEFTMAHPNLIKIVGAVTAIIGAAAGLGAAIVAIKLGVMSVAFAFSGLFTTMLPVAILVGVLAGAVYMLAKWAVNGEGVADTMERIGMVLSAVWEGLSNINNGMATLSESTVNALDDKGLTGVTTTLLQTGYRVKKMFESLWEGLKEAFGPGGFAHESLLFLSDQVKNLMGDVGDTMGLTATGASIDWSNAGSAIAGVISTIVGAFGYGFGLIVRAIDFSVIAIGYLIDGLGSVKQGMNGLEQEAHPLLKTLREIKGIWDWYNDQGDYEPGDQGTLSDKGSGSGAGGYDNVGQYTKWMQRKVSAMQTGMQRPAAKQVADLYNPDDRTEFEKKNDALIMSGDAAGLLSGVNPSQWLKNQDQISGTSTKALEERLAKYHEAILQVARSPIAVYMDGQLVGQAMDRNQAHMDERTGRMGK